MIFLVVLLLAFAFVCSFVWRDVLEKWGVSDHPNRYKVSLTKDKALSPKELKSFLEKTVITMISKGYFIYLYDNNGLPYRIIRGGKSDFWSDGESLCYIRECLDGQILVSDDGGFQYNVFLIEGVFFVSSKKTEENKKFIDDFIDAFSAELEKKDIKIIEKVPYQPNQKKRYESKGRMVSSHASFYY